MSESTPEEKLVRIAMSVNEIDAERLKHAAVTAGMPAAVLMRTLVLHGLAHMDDPAIAEVVAEAAQAERRRRREAASKGGKTKKE